MALEEEELLLKQLPHSVEAEQAVLGSMLIDPRCVPDVIEQLRPEDFYIRQNREIYETIYSMFNFSLTIDPVTVLENMRKNGVYDENVSRNYILQLMDTTPTAANVGEYVAIIKDKTLLRRIAETAENLPAWSRMFSAMEVFPMPGRAASRIRSDLFRPEMARSRSPSPVDRPGTAASLAASSLSRSYTSSSTAEMGVSPRAARPCRMA